MNTAPGTQFAQLRLLSALVGADPLYVQGGGGNASLKDEATLWVKASGLRLDQALERDIFLSLSLRGVHQHIHNSVESLADLVPDSPLRPSIETPLHALLPQRVVLHLHMIDAIVHTLLPGAAEALADRLEGLRWAYVPYARPGMPLSRAIASVLDRPSPPPDVLVLENHGLVVAARTAAEALSLVRNTATRLFLPERHSRRLPDLFALHERNDLGWELPLQTLPHSLAFEPALSSLRANPVLYPDHVVFLGPLLPVAGENELLSETLARFGEQTGWTPGYVVFPDQGVLLVPGMSSGARAMLDALARVALRLPEGLHPRGLSQEAVAELGDWDAEAWRRRMDSLEEEKLL